MAKSCKAGSVASKEDLGPKIAGSKVSASRTFNCYQGLLNAESPYKSTLPRVIFTSNIMKQDLTDAV